MRIGFVTIVFFFFFQAEDGIRDLVRSRGLGDVYKRQLQTSGATHHIPKRFSESLADQILNRSLTTREIYICLLYTSDAADDLLCVDLGGRRIIKKNKNLDYSTTHITTQKSL